MDIFGTVVTAGGLICKFLEACSAYSDDAKSLKTRFDWDMRVIVAINDYFAQRRSQNAHRELAAEDAALLERTATYLDGFVSKVQKGLWKIERKGWLNDGVNRLMWISRRADLVEMEREIFEWTKRFDVRVLGLPKELRTIIPATTAGDTVQEPAVVRANNRLQEFVALAAQSKKSMAEKMLLRDSDDIARKISVHRIQRGAGTADLNWQFWESEPGDQVIFASRKVSGKVVPGTRNFASMVTDMGELAAALNCLDSTADIRLLKVEYYFYHEELNMFLFAQKAPHLIKSMATLEDVIYENPLDKIRTPLNGRLRIAHKLAEAVFFLHTADFLHKNITSSSVVALRRDGSSGDEAENLPDVNDVYLMGFDLIRGTQALTNKEGTGASFLYSSGGVALRRDDSMGEESEVFPDIEDGVGMNFDAIRDQALANIARESAQKEKDEEERTSWSFRIFRHPDRLQGESSPRYIRTYDVYSLGVVLLQIGLWETIGTIEMQLEDPDPSAWPEELAEWGELLGARAGTRYSSLVKWCLGLKGDYIVQSAEFVQEVLDPLEDIVNALS